MQFIRAANDNNERKKKKEKMQNSISSWNLTYNQAFIHTEKETSIYWQYESSTLVGASKLPFNASKLSNCLLTPLSLYTFFFLFLEVGDTIFNNCHSHTD